MKLIKKQHFAAIIWIALLGVLFAGCKPPLKYSGIKTLEYVVATEADLIHLDEYPDLKKLDLSGSTLDHVVLGDWIAIHPWIDITYTIPIGDQLVSCEAAELTVSKGQSTYEELLQNLKYLPALKKLHLENTSLTAEQVAAIEDAYQDLEISFTMELAGDSLDGRATSADLSHLTAGDTETAARQLAEFPNLTDVYLSDADGASGLTPADVETLLQAVPHIQYHYTFELFGKTVSSTDTTLEFTDTDIGNHGVDILRQALDIMPGCTYLKLDNCGIDNDILAGLKQEYPGLVVAWRVDFGGQKLMTDIEALKIEEEITDADTGVLDYFTSLKYLIVDNGSLTDFSFLESMPLLEAATLSKTQLSTLGPLSGCTQLQWLEIADCELLTDLSVAKNFTGLRYLNISNTEITDLSSLKELPLEYLMCLNSSVPAEQRSAAIADHPKALVRFGTGYNYGYGWRYRDYNKNPTDYYEKLCTIFDL